jgi:TrkA domain protein
LTPPNDVEEHDLPGIGRRYDLRDADGRPVAVIIHHSGRRDVYVTRDRGDDMDVAVSLTDDQARRMGAILGGAFFKPAVVTQMESVVGGLLIDWVTLRADSPAAGHTIADMEIRRRTRMTVAAIVRDEVAQVAPEPDVLLQEGDRLVVIGRADDLPAFVRQIVG